MYQETFGWQDVKHHIEIFHRSLLDNHFTVYYLSTLVGVAFFERHDSKSWVIILRLRISKSHTMCHVMSQYTMGHDGSHTHTQWVLDVVFMMLCWKLAFIGLNFVCFENGPIRKENKNCRVRSFPALCSMLLYAPYYSGIAEVAWIWTTVGNKSTFHHGMTQELLSSWISYFHKKEGKLIVKNFYDIKLLLR